MGGSGSSQGAAVDAARCGCAAPAEPRVRAGVVLMLLMESPRRRLSLSGGGT